MLDLKRYKVHGTDRHERAIGIMEPFDVVVWAKDEDQAREMARSDRYNNNRDHVLIKKVEPYPAA